jgi:RNA polymerase sigma-70 factor (ECF subfamily)
MRAYAGDSEAAFNELYTRFSPLVYGYIRRRLPAREVEDFYQKVWRQLHEKRALYQGQPFGAWFFVLIRNLLTDEYRSLARAAREVPSSVESSKEGPDLDALLERLPPDTAELVRRHYLDGESYAELEKSTGLSQPGLRQRLSRAIRALRGLEGKS